MEEYISPLDFTLQTGQRSVSSSVFFSEAPPRYRSW